MTSLRDARRAAGLHIPERSSASCGSRMKATSDVSLGVNPRGSLRSLLIRKRKRNFSFIGMNAPQYYEVLQLEFTRLHGLGWTFRQIAQALNISERTIVAWREELDLPRRPRGRKPRKPRG